MPSTKALIVSAFQTVKKYDDLSASHVGLSQLASLSATFLLLSCYLMHSYASACSRRSRTQLPHPPSSTPLPAFCHTFSQITAASRCPRHLPADLSTLSLMRDPDNTERHAPLSRVAPVWSRAVFASCSAVIYVPSGRLTQQVLSPVLLVSHSWEPSSSFLIYLLTFCSQHIF